MGNHATRTHVHSLSHTQTRARAHTHTHTHGLSHTHIHQVMDYCFGDSFNPFEKSQCLYPFAAKQLEFFEVRRQRAPQHPQKELYVNKKRPANMKAESCFRGPAGLRFERFRYYGGQHLQGAPPPSPGPFCR